MADTQDSGVPPVDVSQQRMEMLLRWVVNKRLQGPATLVLEMHRPLMPLAWSTAMLFGGVVAPFFGPDYYEKIEALRDPALLDRLLKRLQTAGQDEKDGRTEAAPRP
jgi:hypothetical protein